jgi:hypothetical protein
MKKNEYNAAEGVEIGRPEEMILGTKTSVEEPDSSGGLPIDRQYVAG